jgi:hypothetical protein
MSRGRCLRISAEQTIRGFFVFLGEPSRQASGIRPYSTFIKAVCRTYEHRGQDGSPSLIEGEGLALFLLIGLATPVLELSSASARLWRYTFQFFCAHE